MKKKKEPKGNFKSIKSQIKNSLQNIIAEYKMTKEEVTILKTDR